MLRASPVTPSKCYVNLCNFAEITEDEVREFATKTIFQIL